MRSKGSKECTEQEFPSKSSLLEKAPTRKEFLSSYSMPQPTFTIALPILHLPTKTIKKKREGMDQGLSSLSIFARLFSLISKSQIPIKAMNLFQAWLHILRRLFNFIVKSIEAQSIKTVTLGRPMHQAELKQAATEKFTDVHIHGSKSLRHYFEAENSEELPPLESSKDSRGITKEVKSQGGREQEETAADKGTVPKKSVSFSETAQMIETSIKKNKKDKATQTIASNRENGEKPKELRPLRSILKMGSNVNETSA